MEHRLSLYQCYITDHHSQAGRENRSTSMANCSFLLVSQTSTIVQEGDRRVYCSHHTFFPISGETKILLLRNPTGFPLSQ